VKTQTVSTLFGRLVSSFFGLNHSLNLLGCKPLNGFTHLFMPLITGLKPGVNDTGNSSFETEWDSKHPQQFQG
jgi:hypothetical protein